MPISYSGIIDEHAAVRNSAGVFDVSHMGEFILKGENALDLIQRVTTNDASKLIAGRAQYSCMPNNDGGIVDDLLVYCLEENKSYMLVVNAGNIDKDWNWISKFNDKGVEMHNISDKTCLLAIQGPNATKILQSLTTTDILNLKYYTFVRGNFAGVDNVIISATGYTGAGGVEIYFEDKDGAADKVWDAIFAAGASQGIKQIGLGARDTLRLEMGYMLYGNDISDTTSPLEAGLGWTVKLGKSGDFIGKEALVSQKSAGLPRRLVGFVLEGRRVARHDMILEHEGREVGRVTSGTYSPSLGLPIGMGYVETASVREGAPLGVRAGDTLLSARIVTRPFYTKASHR